MQAVSTNHRGVQCMKIKIKEQNFTSLTFFKLQISGKICR